MASMEIGQLAAMTGVTRRTIRYYVAIGLLPPGEGSGPRRFYSETHINRLRLIRQLKDQFLPLDEIKRRLADWPNDEIVSIPDAPRPMTFAEAGSDRVYSAACESNRDEDDHERFAGLRYSPPPPKQKSRPVTHWRRVSLLPDIEVHIRENPSPEAQHLLNMFMEITGISMDAGYREPEANRRDDDA